MITQIISLLKLFNISRIVVSPGSRHYPLVNALQADPFFANYSVVDERNAAYFALGLMQRFDEPVAVCCTSGNAVLNHGPAIAEAFYQRLPLLLLTADRLPELLNQQEDQMIPQTNLFGNLLKYSCQLKKCRDGADVKYCNRLVNEALLGLNRHGRGPVQINFPVDVKYGNRLVTKDVRMIRRFYADETFYWDTTLNLLNSSRVLLVLGQISCLSKELEDLICRFIDTFNCVAIGDYFCRISHPDYFDNAYLLLHSKGFSRQHLMPDVVIRLFGNLSFNDKMKSFLRACGSKLEYWSVGRDGEISDPAHQNEPTRQPMALAVPTHLEK